MVRWLLTLLARPAQQAMPYKSLDKVGVQVHALTVHHDVAFRALERIVRFCHVYHAFKADLALFSVTKHGHRGAELIERLRRWV